MTQKCTIMPKPEDKQKHLPSWERVAKGNLTQICMIRFVWRYLVYDEFYSFKISSYNSEEIELILSFIIQILMQKVVTFA